MSGTQENPASEYFALIGDIVASRDLEQRAAVQRRLRNSLKSLNEEASEAIAAPLKLTAGDEVQGLFHGAESVIDVMVQTADAIHPATMVWGLGFGELSTELDDDVAMLDGPCFHRARQAVEVAARDGRWIGVRGLQHPHGEVLSALMTLVAEIRTDWTDTRMQYVREARHKPQKEVAMEFGVNESTISRALAGAHFGAVTRAEVAARELLRNLPAQGSGVDRA
jgi:hypothetical protein